MADKNKRQKRKEAKDVKRGEAITSEAAKHGVNVDAPVGIGPLGAERKAAIDKRISESVGEEFREGLSQFQHRFKAPDVKGPAALDKEQLKKSYKKQRRAKLGDIFVGALKGISGEKIDPSQFKFTRIKTEREAQYDQYKNASQSAKKRLDEWETKYTDDQLDYLNSKLEDKGISELEKQKINQIKAQIEKTKGETKWKKRQPYARSSAKAKPLYTHQTPEGNWKITNQKNPYSDLYYKLTGNSPAIVNEIGKLSGLPIDPKTGELKSGLKDSEVERLSNTLLSNVFDIQVDEQGNQLAVPKAGRENFLQDLSSYIASTKELKSERDRLRSEMETELYNVSGWGKDAKKEAIEEKYFSLIEDAENQLKESESKLKLMLGGESTESTTQSTQTPTSDQSELDKIYNL